MPLVSIPNFNLISLSANDFGLSSSILCTHPISTVTSVARAADGSLYVLYGGSAEISPKSNARIFKFAFVDGVLTFVWGVEVVCTTSGYGIEANDICVNPVSGHVFVVGTAVKTATTRITLTTLIDITPTGSLSQIQCFEEARGTSVVCDLDGAVYVASHGGYANGDSFGECFQIRKMVNGNSVWTRAIGAFSKRSGRGKLRYFNGNIYAATGIAAIGSSGILEIITPDGTSLDHNVMGYYDYSTSDYWFEDVAAIDPTRTYCAGSSGGMGLVFSWFEDGTWGTYHFPKNTYNIARVVSVFGHGNYWYLLLNGVDSYYGNPQLWKMSSNVCVRKFTISNTIGLDTLALSAIVDSDTAYIVGGLGLLGSGTSYFIITLDLVSGLSSVQADYGVIKVSAQTTNETFTATALGNRKDLVQLSSSIRMYDSTPPVAGLGLTYSSVSTFNPSVPSTSISWWDWPGNDFMVDCAWANSSVYDSQFATPDTLNWYEWSGSDFLVDSAYASSALYATATVPADNAMFSWTGSNSLIDVGTNNQTLQAV